MNKKTELRPITRSGENWPATRGKADQDGCLGINADLYTTIWMFG
jgi:hypothetical protein